MEKYTNFEDFAKAKGYKIKGKRVPDKEWAAPRIEKFLKCPKCGGTMSYTVGSNVVACGNTYTDKDGKQRECRFVRLLDKESQGYAEFLFSKK